MVFVVGPLSSLILVLLSIRLLFSEVLYYYYSESSRVLALCDRVALKLPCGT